MGLPAGRFRERITIQQRSVSRTPSGGEDVSWLNVATSVPAAAEPLRSREFFAAQQHQSEVEIKFTIRYRTGITGAMRVVWRGIAYAIQGQPIDVGAKRENLELMCASGVRDAR